MTYTLRKCPFCGENALIEEHRFAGLSSTFGVVCMGCGVRTRSFFDTEEEAAEAWNRRKRGDGTGVVKAMP